MAASINQSSMAIFGPIRFRTYSRSRVVITASPQKVHVMPMIIGPRPRLLGFSGGGYTVVFDMFLRELSCG